VLTHQIRISGHEIRTTRKKKSQSPFFKKKNTLSSDENLRKYIKKSKKNINPSKLFNLMTQVIRLKVPSIYKKNKMPNFLLIKY